MSKNNISQNYKHVVELNDIKLYTILTKEEFNQKHSFITGHILDDLHRTDGPAYITGINKPDPTEYYFLFGKRFSKEAYYKELSRLKKERLIELMETLNDE